MHSRHALTALSLLWLACTPAASAQVSVASDSKRAALAQLPVGSRLRLNVKGTGRVEGTYIGATGNIVNIDAPRRAFAFSDIDSLWIRRRSTGKGAWVGALIGSIVTATVLASLESSACAGEACNTAGYAALGAITGAGGGALLGAGIGSLSPRWKLRIP